MTVITGNHFLIDAVLGVVVAGIFVRRRPAPGGTAAARLTFGSSAQAAPQPSRSPRREHTTGHRAPSQARAPRELPTVLHRHPAR